MDILDALKFFRKKKKIKQKDMLNKGRLGYQRIESGTTKLFFYEFIEILMTLEMTANEFFSAANTHDNHYILEIDEQFFLCTKDPNNLLEKRKLLEGYNHLKSLENKTTIELTVFCDIKHIFHEYWEEVEAISTTDLLDIQNKIAEKEYFTYYDYRMVSNAIRHFSKNEFPFFFGKMYPLQDIDKRDNRTLSVAYLIFPNIITSLIKQKEYQEASYYIGLAQQQNVNIRNYYFHLSINYLNNLNELLQLKKEDYLTSPYLEKINHFIALIESMGDSEYALRVKQEVNQLVFNEQQNPESPTSVFLRIEK